LRVELQGRSVVAPAASDPRLSGWRRTFTGLYLAYTLGACLLAFFSILLSLTREQPMRGQRIRADDVRHVLLCERDLGILLEDIHKKAFSLQEHALEGTRDLRREWSTYARGWRERWSEVGRRCRLGELSGDGRHPALALLAQAHAEMDELAHVYAGLITTFTDRQEERLQSVRQKLRSARQELRKRKAGG
jgi:hypothetical protein